MDSSFNLGVGGKSSDPTFLGTSTVNNTDPFILYLSSTGTLIWSAVFPSIYDDVVAVSFSTSQTRLAVALDSADVG